MRTATARPAHRLSLTVQYGVAAATLPSPTALRRSMRAALEGDAVVTLRFVTTREGAALNARFRGKPHATNVLAFVYDDVAPIHGDLVICAAVLRREARAQGKTLADHCAHLVVHGMLHLQGYDHENDRTARVMEARETDLLAGLGVPAPYADPYVGRAARAATSRRPRAATPRPSAARAC